MTGLLTQVIMNLVTAQQRLQSVLGLPQQAQAIQASVLAPLPAVIEETRALQQQVASFSQSALPLLNQDLAALNAGGAIAASTTNLGTVVSGASALQSQAASTLGQITALSTSITNAVAQTSQIEAGLNGNVTSLNAQIDSANAEEDAAHKKYWYLLALGPLGIAGLAAALALYLKIRSQVNSYEGQVADLNNQIASIQAMEGACSSMNSACQGLATTFTGFKNSVDFLVNDIGQVETDLSQPSTSVITLAINAAIAEIGVVQQDSA